VQIAEKIKQLPVNAGVYVMKNANGDIIYIGKAKNLKNRVSSYFRGSHDNKVTAMIKNIADFEYFVVATENDALFLEASLINKHKPHYNILLKDDKHFPYICITDNKIEVVRKKGNVAGVGVGGEYFGPYFNGVRTSVLLDIIRTVFDNDPNNGRRFLRGEFNTEVKAILTARMQKASEMKQFELAIAYRDGLRMLDKLTRKVTETNEDADAFTLGACRNLGEILKMDRTPRKIECYDISHTAGENMVGSMVVFIDGVADKSLYRKFKIRHGQGNNDFLSLNEVLRRRLKYLDGGGGDDSFGIPPDIIVIDGGKGQLSATAPMIKKYGITAISLAKRFELIYTTESNEPIVLPKQSYALRLLQRIRDEAHRFAITYHKKLRSKSFVMRNHETANGGAAKRTQKK
jgi:excinuclease ABC subunit C